MESIDSLLGFLVRPMAKAIKSLLPSSLKDKFEPDSNLGDFVGFGVLVIILAILIIALSLYVIHAY